MAGARRGRTGVVIQAANDAQLEPEAVEPAFQRAILKIALELRKGQSRSYDAVVDETIRAMRLDPVSFRRYLGQNGARNMSLLLATATAFGL
jgi:hypothetical protein